jgi:putative endonuclease
MVNTVADSNWQVYIIKASDSKLYTGITTDIKERWRLHASGKGAKFFRGRQPEKICYLENNHNKSSASKREAEIKKMSRAEKITLIETSPYG